MANESTLVRAGSSGTYFSSSINVYYKVNSPDVYTQIVILHKHPQENPAATGGERLIISRRNMGQKVVGEYTAYITLTDAELETIYRRMPDTANSTLLVCVYTYADSNYMTLISDGGNEVDLSLSIKEGVETWPTASECYAEPINTFGSAFDGLYIGGKTKVKITAEMQAKFNAWITSYRVYMNDVHVYSGENPDGVVTFTVDLPKQIPLYEGEDAVWLWMEFEDSRGFSFIAFPEAFILIDYAKPKIDAEAYRCDSAGNKSDSGTYMRIRAKRSYSKVVSDGVQKNFCAIQYRMRKADGAWGGWTTILEKTASSDEVTTGALFGNLETKASYGVQIRAIDDLGEYSETASGLATEVVYMHRTKSGMALGKYAESENMLDVAWDTHLRGEVYIGPDGKTLREYILSVINEGG